MTVRVLQETAHALPDYARISIAFEIRTAMTVTPRDDGTGFLLAERAVDPPLRKDYDAHGGPRSWPQRFDLSTWAFFAAYDGAARVGGAAAVMGSPEIDMLEGRRDLALLWDIRVAPGTRRGAVGSALLEAVEAWALARGARWLKVETQDVNVPACRFYARHGFELRSVDPRAYPELPHETALLWYKALTRATLR